MASVRQCVGVGVNVVAIYNVYSNIRVSEIVMSKCLCDVKDVCMDMYTGFFVYSQQSYRPQHWSSLLMFHKRKVKL